MSEADEDARAATMKVVGAYQLLMAQKRWDEWAELWAEDAEMTFPFAPLGRKAVYRGREEIVGYMGTPGRITVDGVESMLVHPMADPNAAAVELTVRGHGRATDLPYNQSYIFFFELKDGKIWRYREYWNPLVTIDALGGDREHWSGGFGFPDASRTAWGKS